MDATSRFCVNCGATNELPGGPPPMQHNMPPGQQPPNFGGPMGPQMGMPVPMASRQSKLDFKAIIAAICAIIIATTLLGWFTVTIDANPRTFGGMLLEEFLDRDTMRMMGNNVRYTSTIYDINNMMGGLNWMVDVVENEMQMSGWVGHAEMVEFRAMTSPIRMAGGAVTFIIILQTISILAVAAFLYLLVAGHSKAGMVGQIVSIITFATGLIFIIAMAVINSAVSGILDVIGDFSIMSIGINVSASLWVWLMVLLSAGNFVLITKAKKTM